MSRRYIATRLHQALEIAPDDRDLAMMAAAPHYVIDRQLSDMLAREDVARSIAALIEAGIARLPFPSLVVEFDDGLGVRRFAHLFEFGDEFRCVMAVLNGPALTVTRDPISVRLSSSAKAGLHVSGPSASALDQLAAAFGAAVAMLMLNIQGIEKDVIVPHALNAARAKNQKPAVPRHTLLRIGTVVDKSGRETSFGNVRHMPLHLRAGHVRHQACGKGRVDRRLVYIPPTLVNFKPGDDKAAAKVPKRKVTK